jgi:hypothetical protein
MVPVVAAPPLQWLLAHYSNSVAFVPSKDLKAGLGVWVHQEDDSCPPKVIPA